MTVKIPEFLSILRRVYVCKKGIQLIRRVTAALRIYFGRNVILDLVGDCKIKKFLYGNAVQSGKVIQGIDRRIDPPCFIVGIGLSGNVQVESHKFLGIII